MNFGQNLPTFYFNYDTAQTDLELVAASTGNRVAVASIFIMVDTAMDVTFKSGGTTTKFRAFPGANGGVAIPASPGQSIFETDSGESLTVTTSAAGKCSIVGSYYFERV